MSEGTLFQKYFNTTMRNSRSVSGQWVGFFAYGREYGEKLFGERVQFRLFLDDLGEGQFQGESVDIDGLGANFETAIIKGFSDGAFISFTKEYPQFLMIDDRGKTYPYDRSLAPRLSYSSEYDSRINSFVGRWELWAHEDLAGDGSIVDICTGTWEMRKDE